MISWDTEFKWNMVFISTGPHLATLTLTFDPWAPKSNQLTFCSQKCNAIWPNWPWHQPLTYDHQNQFGIISLFQVWTTSLRAFLRYRVHKNGTVGWPENMANGSEREGEANPQTWEKLSWGYLGVKTTHHHYCVVFHHGSCQFQSLSHCNAVICRFSLQLCIYHSMPQRQWLLPQKFTER